LGGGGGEEKVGGWGGGEKGVGGWSVEGRRGFEGCARSSAVEERRWRGDRERGNHVEGVKGSIVCRWEVGNE